MMYGQFNRPVLVGSKPQCEQIGFPWVFLLTWQLFTVVHLHVIAAPHGFALL